jgi:uncharacterized protein YciI
MFVLIARYTRPIEEVDQLLDGHRAWIVRNMEEGRILLTARQVPLVGGLILARAGSEAEVREMIAEDPFHGSGSAEYDVWEFDPVRAAPGLAGLLEAE